MNKVILMGRFTRDPEIRYTQGQQEGMAVTRFTLAVDRSGSRQEGRQNADFPSCVAFGKNAEFIGKYMKQGTKAVLTGRIQTGSYTNREGIRIYTTDVITEDIEFAESKAASDRNGQAAGGQADTAGSRGNGQQKEPYQTDEGGFMNIPDGIDEELSFS